MFSQIAQGKANRPAARSKFFMDRSKNQTDIGSIMRAALAIAAKRRSVLLRLREALEKEDVAEAIKLAKELCGLDD